MVKGTFIIILSFFGFSSYSQSFLPDSFEIGNFINLFSQDSIRIYFNCTGTVTDKKCASFYRTGKIDSVNVNVTGDFYDSDVNDNLYLKATMINNGIEGYAYYYFKNGKISEEGNYKNNIRIGKWIYYYQNGAIEKIYFFDGEEPTVLEAYTKDGKASVVNGNGEIHTEFSNYKQCNNFETWGELLNGKKNGDWRFSNVNAAQAIATETYKEGIFIKGASKEYVYTKAPKIKLSRFYPGENLNLVSNFPGCPGDQISFLEYNDNSLNKSFYPKLQETLNKNKSPIKNQWIIVGIQIGQDNSLLKLNIASSINDIKIENQIYSLIQNMKKWKASNINAKPIESDIYFSILIDNNQVIILPDYVFNNSN